MPGAGGGFDVYAGLPLYFALRAAGREVFLANLTFTYLGETDARYLAPHLAVGDAGDDGRRPLLPRAPAGRMAARGRVSAAVYAFEKVGVRPLRAAYRHLVGELDIDAVVLVDGGTDILMRGDEAGLGTPEEDMTSLAAVAGLDVPSKLVVCLGFGIDAYHGVCHAHVLENIAALERDGGYLGALSDRRDAGGARLPRRGRATRRRTTPGRPSIVNGRSPPRSRASSATSGSPSAPRAASCSSTR